MIQEMDEGQPCLCCKDKCPGFSLHTWRYPVHFVTLKDRSKLLLDTCGTYTYPCPHWVFVFALLFARYDTRGIVLDGWKEGSLSMHFCLENVGWWPQL